MLRRGRSDERDLQRIVRAVRRRLQASGHADPVQLATEPQVWGYVCGLVYALSEQHGRTREYQSRLVRRSYVELFGDACEAVDFLALAPALQSDPVFLQGYKLARDDAAGSDVESSADQRLAGWLGSRGRPH